MPGAEAHGPYHAPARARLEHRESPAHERAPRDDPRAHRSIVGTAQTSASAAPAASRMMPMRRRAALPCASMLQTSATAQSFASPRTGVNLLHRPARGSVLGVAAGEDADAT